MRLVRNDAVDMTWMTGDNSMPIECKGRLVSGFYTKAEIETMRTEAA